MGTRDHKLTERQAALLALMGSWACGNNTGPLLSRAMLDKFGIDAPPEGVHRTAASLARHGLAERNPGGLVSYRLTGFGQAVRSNHHATQQWVRVLWEFEQARAAQSAPATA